jgi:hypothetical protein
MSTPLPQRSKLELPAKSPARNADINITRDADINIMSTGSHGVSIRPWHAIRRRRREDCHHLELESVHGHEDETAF